MKGPREKWKMSAWFLFSVLCFVLQNSFRCFFHLKKLFATSFLIGSVNNYTHKPHTHTCTWKTTEIEGIIAVVLCVCFIMCYIVCAKLFSTSFLTGSINYTYNHTHTLKKKKRHNCSCFVCVRPSVQVCA